MTFNELREHLNSIAEGPDKDSLDEEASALVDDGQYFIDLVVSVGTGNLLFILKQA